MTTQVYMLTKLLLVSSGIICHVHVCSHGQSSKTKKKEERGTKGGSVVGLESRIILEALCKRNQVLKLVKRAFQFLLKEVHPMCGAKNLLVVKLKSP